MTVILALNALLFLSFCLNIVFLGSIKSVFIVRLKLLKYIEEKLEG